MMMPVGVTTRQRAFKTPICPMLPKSEEEEEETTPARHVGYAELAVKRRWMGGGKDGSPTKVYNKSTWHKKDQTLPYTAPRTRSPYTDLVCSCHSSCACDTQRSRRILLAPARELVAVSVTARSIACLTFTAAASTVIWARWIVELEMLLRRRVVGSRGVGRWPLSLPLNVPYR